jgi:hypothetical protein
LAVSITFGPVDFCHNAQAFTHETSKVQMNKAFQGLFDRRCGEYVPRIWSHLSVPSIFLL